MAGRDRLEEVAGQWYSGKGKNIWAGSQDRRFQSLTDPRRLAAERASSTLAGLDLETEKQGMDYERQRKLAELGNKGALNLERLRQGGATGLEGLRQFGALNLANIRETGDTARQKMAGRTALKLQGLKDKSALEEARVRSTPALLESQARYGSGGLEGRRQNLAEEVFEREYGLFPGGGLKAQALEQGRKLGSQKLTQEQEEMLSKRRAREYGLYLDQFGTQMGGLIPGSPSFDTWRQNTLGGNTGGAGNYIKSFMDRYGAE